MPITSLVAIDTLYSIYDEVDLYCTEDDSSFIAIFEDGTRKTFSSYEKAVDKLYRWGYRF